tara:strand:+ start:1474 stop:2400 length:927 start_codon:yes stop_codon:yes gene_type:complete
MEPVVTMLREDGIEVVQYEPGLDHLVEQAELILCNVNFIADGLVEGGFGSKTIWLRHDVNPTKGGTPFDSQTKLLNNLVESEWQKDRMLEGLARSDWTGTRYRSGNATWPEDDNITVVGFPTNDKLFAYESLPTTDNLNILYAPTWTSARAPTVTNGWNENGRGNFNVVGRQVIKTLTKYGNVKYKNHPEPSSIPLPVRNVTRIDANIPLAKEMLVTDLLVTDSSSVAYEFAILDRPIIQITDGMHPELFTDVGVQTTADLLDDLLQSDFAEGIDNNNNRDKWVDRTNVKRDSGATRRAVDTIKGYLS